jgi:hypothetical protein
MLPILTKLKRRYIDSAEFRKYSLYAVGEMALLIVGILVALQVDNWNNDRLQKETLDNHLKSIARNVTHDLESISDIRATRENDYELGLRWLMIEKRADFMDKATIEFAGTVLERAFLTHQFHARSSGYEALKNSGTLDQLQGTDMEYVLHSYYDTVARLETREQAHNRLTHLKAMEVYSVWPEGLARWETVNPDTLTDARFEELQPMYRDVFGKFVTYELIMNTQNRVGPLLREYDTLDRIGRAIIRLVEAGRLEHDAESRRIIDGIHDPRSKVGYPDVIIDGQGSWQAYYLINADANDPSVSAQATGTDLRSPFHQNSFARSGDSLHIDYAGGGAWGGLWLTAGLDNLQPQALDYSGYDTLLLELRGDVGGETIVINMEDQDDIHDGTSTRIELQLSDQWQTFEIDLERFETADLRILDIPFGFVFFEEPVSFSVRTVRFVKAE